MSSEIPKSGVPTWLNCPEKVSGTSKLVRGLWIGLGLGLLAVGVFGGVHYIMLLKGLQAAAISQGQNLAMLKGILCLTVALGGCVMIGIQSWKLRHQQHRSTEGELAPTNPNDLDESRPVPVDNSTAKVSRGTYNIYDLYLEDLKHNALIDAMSESWLREPTDTNFDFYKGLGEGG